MKKKLQQHISIYKIQTLPFIGQELISLLALKIFLIKNNEENRADKYLSPQDNGLISGFLYCSQVAKVLFA